MSPTSTIDLFAGIPVSRFAEARDWYERLLGSPPAFLPRDTEAVWKLAAHRYVYILEQREHAGHARLTLFVEDLDAVIAGIRARGLKSASRESYPNHVRKITYRDVDGNEIGFGGAPRRRNRRARRPGREPRTSVRPARD
jgi:hypothetical protein